MYRTQLISLLLQVLDPTLPSTTRALARRDERGLSQSTENAVLLAGAVTVATLVIVAVSSYVRTHMPH